MFSRLKKIEKELKKIDNSSFLKIIGIKNTYIKSFLKEYETEIKNEKDKLRIFRLYLKYINKTYDIPQNKSLDISDEIESFRYYGFTKKASTHYVKTIDGIYNKDSTINWIYRLIENLIQKNSHKSFSKFLEFCYTEHLDSESEIEEMDEDNQFEDDDQEDDDEEEDEEEDFIDLVSSDNEIY